jgi:hypothetical protein
MIDIVGSLRALICSLQSIKTQPEVYRRITCSPPAVRIEPVHPMLVAEPENQSRVTAILPPMLA